MERTDEDFARDASKSSGYRNICKPCDNARSRQGKADKRTDALRKCARCERPATSPRHQYCDRCRAIRDANRAARKRSGKHRLTSKQRGYSAAHQKLRAKWKPIVETGGVRCARCKEPIIPGTRWDLGHLDGDRSRYNGPEHASCNRAVAKPLYPPRTTTERGYGTQHQKLRRKLARLVETGKAKCARCGEPIPPGSRWELGHDDFDRTLYNGPEHFDCNRNAPRRKPVRV